MDYRLLRQFDTAVHKYYLRIKEIWIREKFGRDQVLGMSLADKQEIYGQMTAWVGELVDGLDHLEVPTPDFNFCRDDFLSAGKALQQAYRDFPADETKARFSLAEYGYHLDAAQEGLKQLWAQYYHE